jgi:hypothetical protein
MTPEYGRTDPFAGVRTWRDKFYSNGWWHSFELPDGTRIEGVNGLEGQKHRISQFPIPQDLRGKRVLDIGAWDGWFSVPSLCRWSTGRVPEPDFLQNRPLVVALPGGRGSESRQQGVVSWQTILGHFRIALKPSG